jgi:hypothetical protein
VIEEGASMDDSEGGNGEKGRGGTKDKGRKSSTQVLAILFVW